MPTVTKQEALIAKEVRRTVREAARLHKQRDQLAKAIKRHEIYAANCFLQQHRLQADANLLVYADAYRRSGQTYLLKSTQLAAELAALSPSA